MRGNLLAWFLEGCSGVIQSGYCVPGMARILWVKVPVQEANRRTREAQGRSREAGSEGSVDQRCELMNKKQISRRNCLDK